MWPERFFRFPLSSKFDLICSDLVQLILIHRATAVLGQSQQCSVPLMHQSIPAVPIPPTSGISIFFKKMGKFHGVGPHKLSKCPGVGTKKEGKCPAPGIVAL